MEGSEGGPVDVARAGDRVVVALRGCRAELGRLEAMLLLRKLAAALGVSVTAGPLVSYEEAPGGYTVVLREGGGPAREYTVPRWIVDAYLRAARELGPGRVRKRVLVEKAFAALAREGRVRDVERYLTPDCRLDWEKLFGSREDYYRLYRAPILLLEAMGVLDRGKGAYITIHASSAAAAAAGRASPSPRGEPQGATACRQPQGAPRGRL